LGSHIMEKRQRGVTAGKQQENRTKKKKSHIFILPLTIGLITLIVGIYLLIAYAYMPNPITVYSSTRPTYAYDENNQQVAFANVTLETNTSAPRTDFPINITLTISGLNVPDGNWTYAYLEGATAAFPDEEPQDWNHNETEVIVLNNSESDPLTYAGSRTMNYTCEGDWNILVYVVPNTWYIVHNIPQNILGIWMKIYSVPNAVHIAEAETVAQMRALEDFNKTTTLWTGIGLILAGLAVVSESVLKMREK
jgi:Ca2+/Na+ antiporter